VAPKAACAHLRFLYTSGLQNHRTGRSACSRVRCVLLDRCTRGALADGQCRHCRHCRTEPNAFVTRIERLAAGCYVVTHDAEPVDCSPFRKGKADDTGLSAQHRVGNRQHKIAHLEK
jgi:hypothetical protein